MFGEGSSWKLKTWHTWGWGEPALGPMVVDTGSLGIKSKIFMEACRAASWPPEGAPASFAWVWLLRPQPHSGTAKCLVCPPSLPVLWVQGI